MVSYGRWEGFARCVADSGCAPSDFVPFAYASTTQSTYVVVSPNVVPGANSEATIVVKCSSPSDSALHFFLSGDDASHGFGYGGARVLDSSGAVAVTGENPNGF